MISLVRRAWKLVIIRIVVIIIYHYYYRHRLAAVCRCSRESVGEPALGHGKKKNDGMYAIPAATEVGPACAMSSVHAYIELTRYVSAV